MTLPSEGEGSLHIRYAKNHFTLALRYIQREKGLHALEATGVRSIQSQPLFHPRVFDLAR